MNKHILRPETVARQHYPTHAGLHTGPDGVYFDQVLVARWVPSSPLAMRQGLRDLAGKLDEHRLYDHRALEEAVRDSDTADIELENAQARAYEAEGEVLSLQGQIDDLEAELVETRATIARLEARIAELTRGE